MEKIHPLPCSTFYSATFYSLVKAIKVYEMPRPECHERQQSVQSCLAFSKYSKVQLNEFDESTPASLIRRVISMVYDALLIAALWMVAAAIVVIPAGTEIEPGNPVFQLYLLVVWYLYFAICWRVGGQTLGMKAWRIRLVTVDDQAPDWSRITVRFLMAGVSLASLGLGIVWVLFDRKCRSWHDMASGTRLVLLPRKRGRRN